MFFVSCSVSASRGKEKNWQECLLEVMTKLGQVPPNAFAQVACLVGNVINQRFMASFSHAELGPSLFVRFTSFAYRCTVPLTAERSRRMKIKLDTCHLHLINSWL
jgi:hypothetical protein